MHHHDSRHNNIISNILPGNHQNTTRNSNSTGQIVYSFTTGDTDVYKRQEIYRYQMYNLSDLRVVKADHLRCNSICLAYALPKNQLDKIKLTNLTFALTVTDPFIIKSKKLGKQDPETLSTSATNVIPVVDRQRKFSLSISLGF